MQTFNVQSFKIRSHSDLRGTQATNGVSRRRMWGRARWGCPGDEAHPSRLTQTLHTHHFPHPRPGPGGGNIMRSVEMEKCGKMRYYTEYMRDNAGAPGSCTELERTPLIQQGSPPGGQALSILPVGARNGAMVPPRGQSRLTRGILIRGGGKKPKPVASWTNKLRDSFPSPIYQARGCSEFYDQEQLRNSAVLCEYLRFFRFTGY